jgi:hypothetical protein
LVVLAEGDQDCRFLAAALDVVDATGRGATEGRSSAAPDDVDRNEVAPSSEVLFVPCGGKDGIPKIAQALRAARVSVVASPDLDILDSEAKLKALIEVFGGVWSDFESDYRQATEQFRRPASPATAAHVLAAIKSALEPHGAEPYTADMRAEVNANLRVSNPWTALKDYGQRAFRGDAAAAAARLLDALDALGVVAVREGELERLAPDLPVAKGPAWLSAAIEAGAHTNPQTQRHIRALIRQRPPLPAMPRRNGNSEGAGAR